DGANASDRLERPLPQRRSADPAGAQGLHLTSGSPQPLPRDGGVHRDDPGNSLFHRDLHRLLELPFREVWSQLEQDRCPSRSGPGGRPSPDRPEELPEGARVLEISQTGSVRLADVDYEVTCERLQELDAAKVI